MTKNQFVGWVVASVSLMLMAGTVSLRAAECQDCVNHSPVLFDVIYLQEGHQVSEAEDYFNQVSAISKKHGLVRLKTYRILANMKGIVPTPALINLWRLDNPQAFQALGADPAYQAKLPVRDALFVMDKVSLLKGEELN